MPGIVAGILIVGYTVFIIYRKVRNKELGKSCCSSCASCHGKCR